MTAGLGASPPSPAVERQDFLLRLTDVLRGQGTTRQVLEQVSQLLGEAFHVNRVGYGNVDEALDQIDWEVCWTDGTVPPLLGRFPASAFGQRVIERLRGGHTVGIANVRQHELTSDVFAQRTSHEVDTRAILVVPLFKAGRLRTIVYLNQRPERTWTDTEIDLMQEVAERTRELIERGRAEEALRDSEARWRGLFERMGEGFFVAEAIRDAGGRMVDFRFGEINPAFERLTGLPIAGLLGQPVTQAIPGVQQELIDIYARVVDTGESAEFEIQVPALNHRWYEARARRIAPDQFSVLFLEVTERKSAQAAQVESDRRYRALFESIDEGFAIVQLLFDPQGQPRDYRFLEINPAFERQTGLPDAVGKTILELVPDIEPFYIQTYGRVALTGESIRYENEAAAMGRWFDAFAFRIGEPAQRRVAILFTDITERKLQEQALRERERELREAQELAAVGSWFWEIDADRAAWSQELRRIFGFGADEPLPSFAEERGLLYPSEDWDRLQVCVQAARESGQSYAVDMRAFRKGLPIWVTARGAAVRDAGGRVVALRGTVQDITERKTAEEALRLADVRKDEFLATLAHELRNPLAPIRNGLEILRRTSADSAAAVRARELMDRQLSHLVRLVDDLLDVSRVSQGKIALKHQRVSLQSVVDLALEISMPLVQAARHELVVDLPEQAVLLDVDPTRIAQVLGNVLNNAAKYTPAGGAIRVHAAEPAGGLVAIDISDNGAGIPRDMLESVFELFTQVESDDRASQSGLGIGLALARRLVELHGGTIRAASDGPGRGSTFTIELPAPAHEPDAGQRSGGQPVAAAPRQVLVVDDNVDAAETLALILQLDGHAVRTAHSGQQAVAMAEALRPDVVFLDIGLPDISGYEVAVRLRALPALEGTKLVALTGWGAAGDKQQARQAGFDLHLTKPVSPESLAQAIATWDR
ncbi:ATP-binding protein [Ramlibacter sp. MMS24-I3-19]|uniref:ATP-binding protein n=1 Tax=Ramlibacter sp. MMS24-I3-19 TaxID=3416606 RepID=UPI003D02041C